MTVFKRIKQIVSANINHLLEKSEDPEKMVKQLIREMDESIVRLRLEVAKAIAAEKRIGRRHDEAAANAEKWQIRSEKAVGSGDDEQARLAIRKKLDCEEAREEFSAQHAKAVRLSAGMVEELRQLENKIQEARQRKDILVARKRRAQAHKAMLDTSEQFGCISRHADSVLSGVVDASASVDSLDEQVTDMEDQAAARDDLTKASRELEARFDNEDRTVAVEDELKKLKGLADEG